MPAYMISYDLRKGGSYEGLAEQLKLWNCVSPFGSVWLGDMIGPARSIRDMLRAHMDENDALIVVELAPDTLWSTVNIDPTSNAWLERHLT